MCALFSQRDALSTNEWVGMGPGRKWIFGAYSGLALWSFFGRGVCVDHVYLTFSAECITFPFNFTEM